MRPSGRIFYYKGFLIMENDEIVFTTQNYDCNGILRRILLALTFGTLAVASTILVQESYLYFCLVGFLLFLMFCMFCSAWKLSYKIRSYITLTDNMVKGRSFPARDCTRVWPHKTFAFTVI